MQDASKALTLIKTQLHKREKNLKAKTTENADKRFIKGKNKESKQNAFPTSTPDLNNPLKFIPNSMSTVVCHDLVLRSSETFIIHKLNLHWSYWNV